MTSYLLSFCTELSSSGIYGLWIKLRRHDLAQSEDVTLKVMVSRSHFMSNTTTETTLQCTESESGERLYFLIQLFEDGQFSKGPLLTLRIDRHGDCAELVWIQKGHLIAGRTVLTLSMCFIDYLSVRSCYLLDSSQVI